VPPLLLGPLLLPPPEPPVLLPTTPPLLLAYAPLLLAPAPLDPPVLSLGKPWVLFPLLQASSSALAIVTTRAFVCILILRISRDQSVSAPLPSVHPTHNHCAWKPSRPHNLDEITSKPIGCPSTARFDIIGSRLTGQK
jgi:hypothetical protein